MELKSFPIPHMSLCGMINVYYYSNSFFDHYVFRLMLTIVPDLGEVQLAIYHLHSLCLHANQASSKTHSRCCTVPSKISQKAVHFDLVSTSVKSYWPYYWFVTSKAEVQMQTSCPIEDIYLLYNCNHFFVDAMTQQNVKIYSLSRVKKQSIPLINA